MNPRLRRLLRDILGRNDELFATLLCRQVDSAVAAVELLCDAVVGASAAEEILEAVNRIEDEGDDRRAELVAELSAVLTTPLDREDLFRVSRSIDDVIDNLRDFASELALYKVDSRELFLPVLDTLLDGLRGLRSAIEDIREPSRIQRSARDAKRANAVHYTYEQCLAKLFERELTMDALKVRELLRRLDIVGIRLEEAADGLADAALKRG